MTTDCAATSMPKAAKREHGASAKQAAFIKKLQAMAERATAHGSLGTGNKLLGIYGSGRFFDGVDEVEPTLILHIDRALPGDPANVRRRFFLQWVWLAVAEDIEQHKAIVAHGDDFTDHPCRGISSTPS